MSPPEHQEQMGKVHLPRITIQYCTQCKWMLRAAYFAQELLSTFGTDLGEVALIPATGGIFRVTIYHSPSPSSSSTGEKEKGEGEGEGEVQIQETILWDRKTNIGFPEVKVLKSLVRNVIDPSRDLGHTDRALRAANVPVKEAGEKLEKEKQGTKECEDCR
ncbi:Rdx family-domain-containing protein [Aspergillus bertholletiae]|uniref:Rdx family-domain-containing protein n=1 Tax=Aspergillus bertholletiae TaxID=1226010 RepID=A0A5N7B6B1_9EURO|nr:Rdx family-domain-containing protein [Aspergillus bertholletiae]